MPLVGIRRRSIKQISSVLALLFVVAAFLASCNSVPAMPQQPGQEQPPGFFPTTPITESGVATDNLYTITFIIAVIVFFIVEGLLIWITIRYRRKPTDTDLPKQTHGSSPLEIMWTIVPAITVTVLFIAALITLNDQFDTTADNPNLTVDVTGFQWQWTFEYQDQGLSFTGSGLNGPVMALPINETVRIRLHATDVIHSFYVPQFLYKKDVVPGRTNEFDVIVTKAGTYGGQCAEFCGVGHADMQFTVQAMEPADFDSWVAQQQAAVPSAPPPPPSGAPSINLTAVSINGFDTQSLSAPANQPIVFNFVNADAAQPHNVAIKGANPDGTDWVGLPITDAGQQAQYVSPPIPAGSYEYFCAVHPTTMTGTLTVGP